MIEPVILQAVGLNKRFGGVTAIDDLSFDVGRGEILGLVGPNASGKSTVLNSIAQTIKLDSGRVIVDGQDVTAKPPWAVAACGVSRTFQQPRLVWPLSVKENILLATDVVALRPVRTGSDVAVGGPMSLSAYPLELMTRFGLLDYADRPAAALSVGQHKLVSLVCALARPTRLLLLDEPIAQLANKMVDVLEQVLDDLRRAGTAILVIEHDLEWIRSICDRVLVINYGREIAVGSPDEVFEDPKVQKEFIQ